MIIIKNLIFLSKDFKFPSAHESGVWTLERLPETFNHNWLLSGGGDQLIKLWDLKSKTKLFETVKTVHTYLNEYLIII